MFRDVLLIVLSFRLSFQATFLGRNDNHSYLTNVNGFNKVPQNTQNITSESVTIETAKENPSTNEKVAGLLNPITIYMYIGIGVGILVLFAIQTCCLIWYFKKDKAPRINVIAQNLNENASNYTARYTKHPLTNDESKKCEPDPVYESLAEVQKAPTPPPLDSLPRSSRKSNKPKALIEKSVKDITSPSTNTNLTPNPISQRQPMPLPKEILKPEDIGLNMELLEKFKKKAEIPVRPPQRQLKAQLQLPSNQVQYTGDAYRESNSSDYGWNIEQLVPHHIYNI